MFKYKVEETLLQLNEDLDPTRPGKFIHSHHHHHIHKHLHKHVFHHVPRVDEDAVDEAGEKKKENIYKELHTYSSTFTQTTITTDKVKRGLTSSMKIPSIDPFASTNSIDSLNLPGDSH